MKYLLARVTETYVKNQNSDSQKQTELRVLGLDKRHETRRISCAIQSLLPEDNEGIRVMSFNGKYRHFRKVMVP